ncbi:MAG: hypothetical protein LBR52_03985, partial [Prevotellaceae bacterium]|nr:hypothetical protein [Prevotellaceae bacterium]
NLSNNTTYYYTLETFGANDMVLLSQSGEFTTNGETTGTVGAKNLSPAKITGYYSVLGVKLPEEPESGIYIITYEDGTAEKKVKK